MDDQFQTVPPECLKHFRQAAPKLRFDPEKYARHLAEYDLTEAQQLMMLRTVWDFMTMICDAGFALDGVSLAEHDGASLFPGAKDEETETQPKGERSP